MAKILVTGASGTIGSETVRHLREAGESVRAAVHSPEKAGPLSSLGAEVVKLDYASEASIDAALEGIDRVMLITPFVEHPVPDVQRFVARAQEKGVAFIVRLSAAGADASSGFALSREHGLGENVVRESGIRWAVLQPNFFMDNFVNFQAESIKAQGAFYGASGGKPVAYVSSRDVGAVAAAILRAPDAHAAKTYVLTGAEGVTDEAAAALLSDLVGKAVRYVDLTPEQVEAGAKQQGAPGWQAAALGGLENVKRQGWAAGVSPAVEEITGRKPESLKDFLARNRTRFV
jgi:uncharacterized protein YbjT (DUF2867 family)